MTSTMDDSAEPRSDIDEFARGWVTEQLRMLNALGDRLRFIDQHADGVTAEREQVHTKIRALLDSLRGHHDSVRLAAEWMSGLASMGANLHTEDYFAPVLVLSQLAPERNMPPRPAVVKTTLELALHSELDKLVRLPNVKVSDVVTVQLSGIVGAGVSFGANVSASASVVANDSSSHRVTVELKNMLIDGRSQHMVAKSHVTLSAELAVNRT